MDLFEFQYYNFFLNLRLKHQNNRKLYYFSLASLFEVIQNYFRFKFFKILKKIDTSFGPKLKFTKQIRRRFDQNLILVFFSYQYLIHTQFFLSFSNVVNEIKNLYKISLIQTNLFVNLNTLYLKTVPSKFIDFSSFVHIN